MVAGGPVRTRLPDEIDLTCVGDKSGLVAERVHWISGRRPDGPIEISARVRSRQVDVAARVEHIDDSRARVTFSDPMRAIAPGQAVVFYDGEVCLGGGWIGRS